MEQTLILTLLLLPFGAAFLSAALGRRWPRSGRIAALLCTGVELALSVLCLTLEPFAFGVGSFGGMGLRFALDGFRQVYLPVTCLLWCMSQLLSGEYFSGHALHLRRYDCFTLLTLGATLGVFLAADLWTAFVFFEIMSLTSYVWVVHEQTPAALRAANTFLAVAVIGGLVALMGLFLLQWRLGTTRLDALFSLAQACPDKATLYAAGGCVLFGFGAKAGMFPLHVWLPKAHPVAPAPASALLSGLLTKTGIWGVLAISCNLFRGDAAWGTLLLTLGVLTMALGAILALLNIDLKRTLACSSMSQIGFVLVGIGMLCLLGEENSFAARGVLLHMVNHSLFKLVLFGCAAVVYKNCHALDLNEIRGFGRGKPLLCAAFLLGALGIGGIPGLSGYISKTLLHEALAEGALRYGGLLRLTEWCFLLSGGLTVAYMTKLFVALFVERPTERSGAGERRYWNAASAAAVLVPAAAIPLLGLTAPLTMDAIADLGTDFLHAAPLAHGTAYFSWECLTGALISLAFGAGIYLLVVRRLLQKDGRYLDRRPGWLDLEELLYRPLLLRWLPALLGKPAALFGENRLTALLGKGVLRVSGGAAAIIGENRVLTPTAKGVLCVGGEAAAVFGENRASEPLAKGVFCVGSEAAAVLGENRVSEPLAKGVFRAGLDASAAVCESRLPTGREKHGGTKK